MELSQKEFEEQQKHRLVQEGAIAEALQYVKYKIAILSGKGGVGKTAATVNLAAALSSSLRTRSSRPARWLQSSTT